MLHASQLANSGIQESEGPKIEDIHLTNQIIGEVQVFIFVMRLLVFEFYGFRKLQNEGVISVTVFEALEEDILFILH